MLRSEEMIVIDNYSFHQDSVAQQSNCKYLDRFEPQMPRSGLTALIGIATSLYFKVTTQTLIFKGKSIRKKSRTI